MTPPELIAVGFGFGVLFGTAIVLCVVVYLLSWHDRRREVRRLYRIRK